MAPEEILGTTLPTVNDIVDGLKDHVWALVRAGKTDAALVLLAAVLEEFIKARDAESRAVLVPLFDVKAHMDRAAITSE